jgi:predicted DNA-binding transcriptional regulator AlpA
MSVPNLINPPPASIEAAHLENQRRIAERVHRTLIHFDHLPNDSLVDIHLVSVVLGRSRSSIWRDVAHGRLAAPVRVGARSTRWRASDVRAALRMEVIR